MYQYLLAVGIALGWTIPAWGFPIDVDVQPGAAEVSVSSTDLINIAAINLTSHAVTPLRCQVTFVNGPERPLPRRVHLQPGEEVTLTHEFTREIIRVRVGIDCAPE
ncbi:MAG: 3-phosphoglycerate kinase [Pseudomonas sp.]